MFAIHATCGWRIVDPDGIIAGTYDHYIVDGEQCGPDYTKDGAKNLSPRNKKLYSHLHSADLIVERIIADNLGSVHLSFTMDCYLELIPIDSLNEVHWRLESTQTDFVDFVVEGNRTERTND
ncbi:MAG: hypothetical protein H7Y38_03715 [Armatimonadetes bacterium]|nr:hypothetical protein [Armatimonadota bacterium]